MATEHGTETGFETEQEYVETEDGTRRRLAFVDRFPEAARTARICLWIAFAAFGVGALFGLIQALHRTNTLRIIPSSDYYTILTGHGVLLALVFTTFGIAGLFHWANTRSLGVSPTSRRLTQGWLWTMSIGTLLAAGTIVGGLFDWIPASADVLYTFYAPLEAHPLFYIGAALLIVGSWGAGLDWFLQYREWRSHNPDARIPLQSFMVMTTMLMWYLSSAGVAIEVVFFLIPWSLGLISQVDPLLTRTLFWYFGHPVVYFWLLPAYVVWYTVLPKLAGGRLFSDPLARVTFVLFLLLSTPVGFHHQYTDPGIASGYKLVAMTNTFFLLLPSLLTLFTVVASMEHGARQQGAKGYLAWLKDLPWERPEFSGVALAGIMFAAGGFSGMINAGMNINYLIHNTIWVPGHFHLTVGTAYALTLMAIAYWLVPQLTGKRLQFRGMAAIQPFVWFVGMVLMSNAMHRGGLAGIPRRTAEPQYDQVTFDAVVGTVGEMRIQIAIGGTLLFVGAMMFLAVMAGTWALGKPNSQLRVNGSIPEPLSGAEESPRVLDNLKLWTAIAIALVLLAYGIPLYDMVADGILWPGSVPFPE
ncbi:b(o/a)3-type cytochrome-c oxidase subunit 1 [Halolamina sp. R1-12]|uniref:Cytochrome c oxidase subunit 1 n=1 Tax=Halolamina pelagica TaxID=699431 RepID=A0A1I5NHF1_9EURY|nr:MULTISPECIES: b(o/a)3-type cytochrome-c oxidase subunit 1 [Halolamina]NHX36316.1 b(o/a)3-type cytochrome-c oxidase subunit 1 [Halolamina sp. R1-12]SFP21223.1 cytochrome c oxidase subunit 1 [Halolamina pelagica]